MLPTLPSVSDHLSQVLI